MEKKYDKILKSCSKKKSTIEVVFGIDKKRSKYYIDISYFNNWFVFN